jgi:hypothetical protein
MGRAHVEHIHSPEIDATPLEWSGWPAGASVKSLSVDEDTGALSSLVQLPAGYRRPISLAQAETEVLVISGVLRVGDATLPRPSFLYTPAGTAQESWEAIEDAELLFMTRTGPPGLAPASGPAGVDDVIVMAADELSWGPNPIADGPPRVEVAIQRMDPTTGEMSALVRHTGTNERTVFEYHDCVEEVFLLDGWLELQNSETEGGEMRPGSYFWRPPYVTHGQSRNRDPFYYVYTDSRLVNRRTDGLHRTPEENRIHLKREIAAGAG